MSTLLVFGIFFVIGYSALFAYSACVVAARADDNVTRDRSYVEGSPHREPVYHIETRSIDYVREISASESSSL